MKSIRNMGDHLAAAPLLADDVLEFHAARLLLLFKLCGVNGRIDGLTKMAKLDFFVRYPGFFAEACKKLGVDIGQCRPPVESTMVRYHYGPWDRRYYHVLGYLEGGGLLEVSQEGKRFRLALTDAGEAIAKQLQEDKPFHSICEHMRLVKKALGNRSGSRLKNLIYETFDKEITRLSIGEAIE